MMVCVAIEIESTISLVLHTIKPLEAAIEYSQMLGSSF